ncbi:MAG: transposase [Gammaproteobacteria bacterium]|nr:transposase [Gammaproteobacteria bacterium]
MTICDLKTKNTILTEVAKEERLIGDIADDYGVSHRTVYNWIKVTRSSRKQATAAKKVARKYADTAVALEQHA